MASEIRANTLKNRVGLGTVSFTNTGPVVSGIITATGADINGDIDVDGHTNLDNVSISGITTASTINSTGNIEIDVDNGEFRCGAGGDFKISHNGSLNILRSDFPTVFRNAANNQTLALFTPNGAVNLYHSNGLKFSTTSSGIDVTGNIIASGNLTPGGTLYLTDAIEHTDDSNTKIRFPAADTISFTTSGSERVKIFSNGGTAISNAGSFPSSTNETLFIQGEGHNGHGTSNTRSVFNITAAMTSRPGNGGGGLWIGARTNEDTAVIGTRTANGNLAIETHNSGWGERLRIDSTGRVLIGTTSANQNNKIIARLSNASLPNTSSASVILAENNGNSWITIGSAASNYGGILFSDSGSADIGQVRYLHGENRMEFIVNTSERLRILSSGELRIISSGNNNDPAHLRLHSADVSISANDAIGVVRFAGRDAGGAAVSRTGALIQATAAATWDTLQTTGYSATNIDFFTQDNSGIDTIAAGARLRITNDGKLLVGATSQTNGSIAEFSKSVGGGGAGCHVTVENTSTNSVNNTAGYHCKTNGGVAKFFAYSAPETYIQSRSGGTADLILQASGSSNMRFFTNGNERLRIDSSGNLLIDATGVGNASTYARNIFISGSSNNGITIHTTDTSGSNRKCCIFFGDGTSVGDMAKGMLFYDHNGDYFHMSTDGGGTGVTKSSMRLSADGTVRFDSTPTTVNSISLRIQSHKTRTVNDNNGIVFFDEVNHTQAAIFVSQQSTSAGTSDLVFSTSSGQVVSTLQGIPERMRLTSEGYLGLGDSNPDARMHLYDTGTANSNGFRFETGTSGVTAKFVIKTTDNGDESKYLRLNGHWTEVGVHNNEGFRIRNSGNSIAMYVNSGGSYRFYGSNLSDLNLKEDIETISTPTIDLIKQVSPKLFKWKNDPNKTQHGGFIAQEMQPLFPKLINGTDYDESRTDYGAPGEDQEPGNPTGLAFDYDGYTAYLTKAMQELIAKVESLEAEVASLKG